MDSFINHHVIGLKKIMLVAMEIFIYNSLTACTESSIFHIYMQISVALWIKHLYMIDCEHYYGLLKDLINKQ